MRAKYLMTNLHTVIGMLYSMMMWRIYSVDDTNEEEKGPQVCVCCSVGAVWKYDSAMITNQTSHCTEPS